MDNDLELQSDNVVPDEKTSELKNSDVRNTTSWRKRIKDIELHPDPIILAKVKELLTDKNIRISKVSELILKDPVTTLEILSLANSDVVAHEKSKISAVHTAIVRIGSEELFKLIDSLLTRALNATPNNESEMNLLRTLSCRSALIAEILSNHLQRDIVEVSQTCSLLSYYGLMLACEVFGDDYVEISQIKKRTALNYKLQSNFSFDPTKVQLDYFKNKSLPSIIFFAFDKELKCNTKAQSSLRFIVEASSEIAEAQEDNKLDKYRYFNKLPTKSSLRLLKINENAYETIFSEIEEVLGIVVSKPSETTVNNDSHNSSFEEHSKSKPSETIQASIEDTQSTTFFSRRAPTLIMDRSELVNYFTQSGSTVFIEKASEVIEQERTELSSSSEAIIGMLQSLCTNATSAKDLIKDLMEVVTEKGPFSRTAIIEITENRKEAYIHTAVGEDFDKLEKFQMISVKDSLSPLSIGSTKVQSFNSKNNTDNISPFGITSYAISPIKTNTTPQLVFYADCGTEKPLPFEARKVFRLAVAILNQTLPKLSNT